MRIKGPSKLKKLGLTLRDSGKTKDFLVFLVFVAIAAVFWFILALNDDMQDTYEVNVDIQNIPDSVTFITVAPHKLHVVVRDRGLNIVKHKVSGVPTLNLNFEEFADGNNFRVSHTVLQASLRRIFGSSASMSSVTPDSLSAVYTTYPGQILPLDLVYDVSVASGMILGTPKISNSTVKVFSTSKSDTLRKLFTEKVVLRTIDHNVTIEVPVEKLPGKRVIPDMVSVTFPVEQLVKKESEVLVEADNIPLGHDILFFPSRVKVVYFVPISKYTESNIPLKVEASFNEAFNTSSDKVGIKVVSKSPYIRNVELLQDSVEYTLVKK